MRSGVWCLWLGHGPHCSRHTWTSEWEGPGNDLVYQMKFSQNLVQMPEMNTHTHRERKARRSKHQSNIGDKLPVWERRPHERVRGRPVARGRGRAQEGSRRHADARRPPTCALHAALTLHTSRRPTPPGNGHFLSPASLLSSPLRCTRQRTGVRGVCGRDFGSGIRTECASVSLYG